MTAVIWRGTAFLIAFQSARLLAVRLDHSRQRQGTRLACQLYPTADLAITLSLPADAGAAAGTLRAGFEGRERQITVVFVDIRSATGLGEAKMPYDILYLLNRFFHEMSKAIAARNGHYSQFTGDGLMALCGLNATDPRRRAC